MPAARCGWRVGCAAVSTAVGRRRIEGSGGREGGPQGCGALPSCPSSYNDANGPFAASMQCWGGRAQAPKSGRAHRSPAAVDRAHRAPEGRDGTTPGAPAVGGKEPAGGQTHSHQTRARCNERHTSRGAAYLVVDGCRAVATATGAMPPGHQPARTLALANLPAALLLADLAVTPSRRFEGHMICSTQGEWQFTSTGRSEGHVKQIAPVAWEIGRQLAGPFKAAAAPAAAAAAAAVRRSLAAVQAAGHSRQLWQSR